MSASGSHYGKYRGVVTNNADPMMLGRLKAAVPSLLGNQETAWALPSLPYAGNGVGILFVPPIGANVWVEFEEGKIAYPIWTGCFWGAGESPIVNAGAGTKIIETEFASIEIDDAAQSVTIATTNGLEISMDTSGMELSSGLSSLTITPARISTVDGTG